MGKRGPKPTPSAKLRLVGSRKLENRQDEPKPELGVPSPPAWLSREASAEWKRVTPELARIGVLAQIDRAILVGYVESWSDFHAAVQAVRDSGTIFTTPNGHIAKHPNVTVLNESRMAFLRFAQELGLSPSARARLAASPKDHGNPLTQFVERHG